MKQPTILSLFAGLGGGTLGFVRAGFRSVGAIDNDPAAIADLEMLTGARGTVADLGAMQPGELRAIVGGQAPDVVFTSPPCKSFSGCLPLATSKTARYKALSSLAQRGIMLVLEAWATPPKLILLENVPRIQSRGRAWLDQTCAMLRAYGYAVTESTHDCGELGGLAQHRRRFLLIARHMEQVRQLVYVPPVKRVRGIGEALASLPVPLPGSTAGGPMHRLPRMSALNWLRLALIPAGKDWRALPERVTVPCQPRRGAYAVVDWSAASATVTGAACHDNGPFAVADPRSRCVRREGSIGITKWESPSTAVIANGGHHNGPWQVADPRLKYSPHPGARGVADWGEATGTVIGDCRSEKGANVCDPRLPTRGARQNGGLGVVGWGEAGHAVVGHSQPKVSWSSVADPREVEALSDALDLESRTPRYCLIRAFDGTWHRPMTTLELAALQGFPVEVGGAPLVLDGRSHKAWRQRIGNAVPPPAAEAIARSCMATLQASSDGTFRMCSDPVWVDGGVR